MALSREILDLPIYPAYNTDRATGESRTSYSLIVLNKKEINTTRYEIRKKLLEDFQKENNYIVGSFDPVYRRAIIEIPFLNLNNWIQNSGAYLQKELNLPTKPKSHAFRYLDIDIYNNYQVEVEFRLSDSFESLTAFQIKKQLLNNN